MSDDRNRQPAGVPAGGQFAATPRDEPAVELGAPATGDLVDVVDPDGLRDDVARARYTKVRDALVTAGITGKLEAKPYSVTLEYTLVELTTAHDNETYLIGYGSSVSVASMDVTEARGSTYPKCGPDETRPALMIDQLHEAQRIVATARVWPELAGQATGDVDFIDMRVHDDGEAGHHATVTAVIDGAEYTMTASTLDGTGPEHVKVTLDDVDLPPFLAKAVLEKVGRSLGGPLFPENHAAVILRTLAIQAPRHKTWPASS